MVTLLSRFVELLSICYEENFNTVITIWVGSSKEPKSAVTQWSERVLSWRWEIYIYPSKIVTIPPICNKCPTHLPFNCLNHKCPIPYPHYVQLHTFCVCRRFSTLICQPVLVLPNSTHNFFHTTSSTQLQEAKEQRANIDSCLLANVHSYSFLLSICWLLSSQYSWSPSQFHNSSLRATVDKYLWHLFGF